MVTNRWSCWAANGPAAVLIAAFCIIASPIRIQPSPQRSVHRAVMHPLKPIPSAHTARLEASLYVEAPDLSFSYDVQATYDVFAVSHPASRVRFIREGPGKPRLALDFPGDGHVLNIYSPEGGAVVVIVFELGSGIRVRAFRVDSAGVSPVLKRDTHLPPEFTLDGILINTGWVPVEDRCCTAEDAEIWKWTGVRYKLLATVPFGQRYEALAKLEHEEKTK